MKKFKIMIAAVQGDLREYMKQMDSQIYTLRRYRRTLTHQTEEARDNDSEDEDMKTRDVGGGKNNIDSDMETVALSRKKRRGRNAKMVNRRYCFCCELI